MAERAAPFASAYPRPQRVCAECGKPKAILVTCAKIGGGFVLMCSGCMPHRAEELPKATTTATKGKGKKT